MAFWKFEKQKATMAVDYAPVRQDAEDDEHGGTRVTYTTTRPEMRKPRTWQLYLLGLAAVALTFIIVDTGETIAHRYFGGRLVVRDPFANWGQSGSGTEQLAWYPTDFLRDVIPVPCHSHNDYWRTVPVFTALYAGCTGVEADVWLRNGDLLVGHDTASLQPNRTFQTLYVNPLVEILQHQNPKTEFYDGNDNGVFDTDPEQTLVLLVDIKTDGAETWPWVVKQLTPLREKGWLSYYDEADGQFHPRPITVVGTGNAPFDQILSGNNNTLQRRDAFYDAPLNKLEEEDGSGNATYHTYNATNSYYASVDFWHAIGAVWWRGGPNITQLGKIRSQIQAAKDRGLVSRYWGLPPWPIHVRNKVWEVLVEEGIGMLNVDDVNAATKEDWTRPGTF
ncbi:uncharacterized protein C8A04DRAFT_24930 [Dichotomopilus funicola]|uniref:Altered inheritance of mitochondria protein 6 n=1 Tax=Dichotomopilus funicola TaxID=1934379 RepID=A0AAN6V937_9PEZI|nr:hypothetical protein C8A04DRAFT_24930 [Dichotomopilus funicola]